MNSEKPNLLSWIGLGGVPWTIRVYLFLLVLFVSLILATAFLDLSSSLGTLVEDGFKMVLGGLLGSLALMRERQVDEPMSDGVE